MGGSSSNIKALSQHAGACLAGKTMANWALHFLRAATKKGNYISHVSQNAGIRRMCGIRSTKLICSLRRTKPAVSWNRCLPLTNEFHFPRNSRLRRELCWSNLPRAVIPNQTNFYLKGNGSYWSLSFEYPPIPTNGPIPFDSEDLRPCLTLRRLQADFPLPSTSGHHQLARNNSPH